MKNKVSVVLFSRNQYICHNFLFNVCMWNRHTNMELISQIQYNLIMGCIILLINITYCPTRVKNYLNFVEFFVLFETPSYVWSNLFLRTSSWTDGYMSFDSKWKLYAYSWYLPWNITCAKKASCFVKIMLYELFYPTFSLFNTIQLRISDHFVLLASSKTLLWIF